ncbi:MAG: HNH endonuclease [Burkholderiaceae bacterium]
MGYNAEAYTPNNADKVRRFLCGFERFIIDRGGEVLAPTSDWELVRFKTATSTAIIYTKASGAVTFYGGAKGAWDAFLRGASWTAGNKTKRKKGGQAVVIQGLIRRDGRECFYCGLDTTDEDASVEHVVPLNAGGTNHIANKVLAHKRCNSEAGHLSVIEKIKLRESKRAALSV